jgi:hypothetical protein
MSGKLSTLAILYRMAARRAEIAKKAAEKRWKR